MASSAEYSFKAQIASRGHHCVKCRNFNLISWCGNFVERNSFRPKLCGNCAFPQNVHNKKLDEITVLYAVHHVFKKTTWNNVKEGGSVRVDLEKNKLTHARSVQKINFFNSSKMVGHIPREIFPHVYYFI